MLECEREIVKEEAVSGYKNVSEIFDKMIRKSDLVTKTSLNFVGTKVILTSCEVRVMKKMGRPTAAKKDLCIKLRIDPDTNKKLEVCMKIEHKNKSEMIRSSILEMYKRLMEDNN